MDLGGETGLKDRLFFDKGERLLYLGEYFGLDNDLDLDLRTGGDLRLGVKDLDFRL